jgi:hypothetical protein
MTGVAKKVIKIGKMSTERQQLQADEASHK